jgi:hypothetical protein
MTSEDPDTANATLAPIPEGGCPDVVPDLHDDLLREAERIEERPGSPLGVATNAAVPLESRAPQADGGIAKW